MSTPDQTPKTGAQAADLLQALRGYGQLPGAQLAGFGALIGIGVVLAFAFLIGIVMPDNSLVDLSDDGAADLFHATLNQAWGTTLATFNVEGLVGDLSFRISPLLFVAVPIGGCALGTYLLAGRLDAKEVKARLIWSAAVAIPFAIMMFVVALLAGTTSDNGDTGFSASQGSVFLLSLVWGGLGGLIGAGLANRRDGVSLSLSGHFGLGWKIGRAALVPLGLTLVITALVGTGVWVVQTVRDASEARDDRSVATALADDVFFSGDYGLRYFALGTGASFQVFNGHLLGFGVSEDSDATDVAEATKGDYLPIPVDRSHAAELLDANGSSARNPSFNLFSYGDVLPAWVFAPLLLILMIAPAFFALSGGFGIARVIEASTAGAGAGWGALVGPIWAIATAILNLLTQDIFFGQISGDGFFAIVLLAGAALGALGGFVASQQAGDRGSPAPLA